MRLLELWNNKVTISAECVVIPPFDKIWSRDKSKDKNIASKEIAYIYFKLDFKSPYLAYSDEERESILISDLFGTKEYKPDKLVQEGLVKYKELMETPITRMLHSAFKGVDKLEKHLREVDLEERNRMGMPVFKAKEVSDTIGGLSKVASSVKELMDKAYMDEDSAHKNRGGASGGKLEFQED